MLCTLINKYGQLRTTNIIDALHLTSKISGQNINRKLTYLKRTRGYEIPVIFIDI